MLWVESNPVEWTAFPLRVCPRRMTFAGAKRRPPIRLQVRGSACGRWAGSGMNLREYTQDKALGDQSGDQLSLSERFPRLSFITMQSSGGGGVSRALKSPSGLAPRPHRWCGAPQWAANP
jgi:hypothetical protein